MKNYIKASIFILLLISANLFLLKDGYWFAQDTGFWPKNNQEALMMLIQQLRVFINFGYYLGFDQGLFNFTRIETTSFIAMLSYLFGFAGSQIVFILSGYILTFFSFYLFSGIFFSNKNARYVLALLYTFNPFSYTLQGYIFYSSTIPLFLYSYYKYFYSSKDTRLIYLLLNIFSAYLWVAYIRFLQGNFFVIIPYIVYLFFKHNKHLSIKKLVILSIAYIFLFSPSIYSVSAQLVEKSQTAFFYGNLLGKFVGKEEMIKAFNLFQSIGMDLYTGKIWIITGILFFLAIEFLIITLPKKHYNWFIGLNLVLILFSITLFRLDNITGDAVYLKLLPFFPFIINGSFFALFVLYLPSVVLIGLLTKDRVHYLYIFASLFIITAALPFLNLSDPQFKKVDLSVIPAPYHKYFIDPYPGIVEATYYYPDRSWRAEYMDKANIKYICFYFGLHYPYVIFDDPRLVTGDRFYLSQALYRQTDINNLRVTHNLKNIIVPNDAVNKKDIEIIKTAHQKFNNNLLLDSHVNENFTQYYFKDKDLYDFYIFSPSKILYRRSIDSLTDNSIQIQDKPVLLSPSSKIFSDDIQSAKVAYKISPWEATKYYLHISNITSGKPFIIQLNQDFKSTWKIKLMDKKYFNNIKCISDWEIFPITNNERCQYNSNLLEIKDTELLVKQNAYDDNHIQSNFINNAWIITPKNNKDIYAVIIYEKQIYYTITIFIFGTTLAFLILFAIMQEVKYRLAKNKI